jgi:hypothetical protein
MKKLMFIQINSSSWINDIKWSFQGVEQKLCWYSQWSNLGNKWRNKDHYALLQEENS